MRVHSNESELARLRELYEFDILDSPDEEEYNDLVAIASQIAGMPISLLSLMDVDRQWVKAGQGIENREFPRDETICDLLVQQASDDPLVIPDTKADQRVHRIPSVAEEPGIRFYAGFPLASRGFVIGTLCVLDRRPNQLSAAQIDALKRLSRQAMRQIETRHRSRVLQEQAGQLEQQRSRLQALLGNQRKIISVLAHDTRGPLHSIFEILATADPGRDDLVELIGMVTPQLELTVDVIDKLINWGIAHLEGKQGADYPLAAAVAEALEPHLLRAREKEVVIETEIEEGVDLPLSKDMLCFIVRNLVHNAVKYTEKGGVKLRVGQTAEERFVEVTDTGIGMPPQIAERLFHQRTGSRQGTREESGTGIGLMLIHDFIQQSGGQIVVDSQSGQGTRIRIAFASARG